MYSKILSNCNNGESNTLSCPSDSFFTLLRRNKCTITRVSILGLFFSSRRHNRKMAELDDAIVLDVSNFENFQSSYRRFIDALRVAATYETSGIVRTLQTTQVPKAAVPKVQIHYADFKISLHLSYESLYCYGYNHDGDGWISISKGGSHIDNAIEIGFHEDYASVGFSSAFSLKTLGRFHAIRDSFMILRKNSLNSFHLQPFRVPPETLKKAVANIIVCVCEAARFDVVFRHIFGNSGELCDTSVDLIKNWGREQDRYYSNIEGYQGELRLVQYREPTSALCVMLTLKAGAGTGTSGRGRVTEKKNPDHAKKISKGSSSLLQKLKEEKGGATKAQSILVNVYSTADPKIMYFTPKLSLSCTYSGGYYFDEEFDMVLLCCASFKKCFKEKSGIILHYLGLPLLRWKQRHSPRSLLSEQKSGGSMATGKTLSFVHTPGRLLFLINVSLGAVKPISLLHSLLHQLESLMLAIQLRDEISCGLKNCFISSSLCQSPLTRTEEALKVDIIKFDVESLLFPFQMGSGLDSRIVSTFFVPDLCG